MLTLAIGLGGTAAMFAAVNAAFLKPLPFPDERTLVKIYQGGATRSDIRIALGVLHDWHRDSRFVRGDRRLPLGHHGERLRRRRGAARARVSGA